MTDSGFLLVISWGKFGGPLKLSIMRWTWMKSLHIGKLWNQNLCLCSEYGAYGFLGFILWVPWACLSCSASTKHWRPDGCCVCMQWQLHMGSWWWLLGAYLWVPWGCPSCGAFTTPWRLGCSSSTPFCHLSLSPSPRSGCTRQEERCLLFSVMSASAVPLGCL